MLFKTIFIGVLFVYGCSGNSPSHTFQSNSITVQNNSIKIFRATEEDDSFRLVINDKFHYYNSLPSFMSSSPGTYIGMIKKEKHDSLKIYLKINNHDTLFFFNARGVDSLLLGRKVNNKGFYILTNQQKAGWLSE